MQDKSLNEKADKNIQFTKEDIYYMKLALDLADMGTGRVNPNPLVGAVIVKDGCILGKGYHESYGGLHAERNAIKACRENIDICGSTMYVTLEPCCHYGKTPPCTEAIIENKIKRVVVASLDPNPLVAGKGIKILEEAGIQVDVGLLKEDADRQNRIFRNYIRTKKPLVTMKYAMTIDGKIATHTGKSKWITGHEARKNVHLDRLRNMAIMVGVGTVLADEPMLDCRLEGFIRNPIRIIIDSGLRTPLESRIVTSASGIETIIFTISDDLEKIKQYEDRHCRVIVGNKKHYKYYDKVDENGRDHLGVDLNYVVDKLGQMGIDSILLEGGSQLNFSALESGIVDRVQAYIAPKIFGGGNAKSPVGGRGVDIPDQAFSLENMEYKNFGQDILVEGDVKKCLQE